MTETTTVLGTDVHLGAPVVRGALHLYPLTTPSGAPPRAYAAGPTAASALLVSELEGGASVPELDATNLGRQPILLIEGESILGGLQNRTLNVSVLLPAAATVRIPVSCVEAGRWGSHRQATKSARHAPARLRARKTESVNRSFRAGRGRRSDQDDVWSAVGEYASDLGVASPSHALEDVQASVEPVVDRLVDDLRPAPHQVGVIAAVGGRPVSLELFDDPAVLAAYWDSLVRGYALDAVSADAARPIRPDRALRFLRRIARAPISESPGVGLGDELHLDAETVTGTGLRWDGKVRHLAAFRVTPAVV